MCEVKGKTKEGPGGRKRNKKSAALAFYFFPSSIFWGDEIDFENEELRMLHILYLDISLRYPSFTLHILPWVLLR